MLWTSSSLLWELDRYTCFFQIDKSHFKEAPLSDERDTLAPVFSQAEILALLFKALQNRLALANAFNPLCWLLALSVR
jgi:hypothetical protein